MALSDDDNDWQAASIKEVFKWSFVGEETYDILSNKGYSTFPQFEFLLESNIEQMRVNKVLNWRQAAALTVLIPFIVNQIKNMSVTTRSGLTDTKIKASINLPAYQQWKRAQNAATAANPVTLASNMAKTLIADKPKLSLNNYPKFSGCTDHWPKFKREFLALLQMQDYIELVDEYKQVTHDAKMLTNVLYQQQSKQVYDILYFVTVGGIAHSMIKNDDHKGDGIKAFIAMSKHYDLSEHREFYKDNLLKQLDKCKLHYNSTGGFEAYYLKFKEIC